MIKKIAKKITPCAISAVLTAGIATSPISVYADELENPQATEEVETPTSTIEKTETNIIPEAKEELPSTLSNLPSADTNEGAEKVPSEGTNLGTNESTNSDTNKVPDKVPETETGSDTNKSPDNKPETNEDANEGSNEKPEMWTDEGANKDPDKKPSTEPAESEGKSEVLETPVLETPSELVKPEVSAGPRNNNSESDSTTVKTKGETAVSTADGYSPNASNSNYRQAHHSQNLETERFIAMIGEQARQIGQEHNLYASVMIAQAILESGSGNSQLAQAPYNNLFGIKGAYKGNSVTFNTQEDDGTGNMYTIQSAFRAYKTTADSLEDYANLLTVDMGDHYAGAWKSNAATPVEACQYLQGRYATSTQYAASLIDLIETYNLTRFDEPLKYEVTGLAGGLKTNKTDEEGNPREINMEDYADLAAFATSKLGYNYVWGGESDAEGGYDCSGLIYYAYQQAFGVTLPRTSQTQQYLGTEVAFDDLQMGDLLFWQDDSGDTYHVAMYLSDGYYIQAANSQKGVIITAMDEHTPSFAKRIINTQER